jgi:hypothetical protein
MKYRFPIFSESGTLDWYSHLTIPVRESSIDYTGAVSYTTTACGHGATQICDGPRPAEYDLLGEGAVLNRDGLDFARDIRSDIYY